MTDGDGAKHGAQVSQEPTLRVSACQFPQEITCPECDHTFPELVTEIVGATECPDCRVMIQMDHSPRHDDREDTTEQEGLDAFA